MNFTTVLSVAIGTLLLIQQFVFADFAITLAPSSSSLVEEVPASWMCLSVATLPICSTVFSHFSMSGGPGLEFANPQTESHLSNSNYVFFNRSNSVFNALPSTVVTSASSMNVSDLSDNGMGLPNPFTVGSAGSESLLARLNLNALTAGTYSLQLLGTSSFSDAGFNNILFNTPSLNISVTAVPEPSSIGGAVALGLGRFWLRRKRRVGEGPLNSERVRDSAGHPSASVGLARRCFTKTKLVLDRGWGRSATREQSFPLESGCSLAEFCFNHTSPGIISRKSLYETCVLSLHGAHARCFRHSLVPRFQGLQ